MNDWYFSQWNLNITIRYSPTFSGYFKVEQNFITVPQEFKPDNIASKDISVI